jgi:hypothetical protein
LPNPFLPRRETSWRSPHSCIQKDQQMSMNLKAAALALGVASLFGAGPASAAVCNGTVQPTHMGRTYQCYYLPTVSNGRVTGLQKEVNYGGTPFHDPYGHPGRPTGAANGGAFGGHHGGR